ncbi:hypothetical protein E8E13_009424 [Curvularia kusanoi]|uniref:SET domain-containing protein n=1 Tax=Curvularia kusanoi TaxID=90978 RepID=A0A9P4TEE9_CURKU|nr:hypothetical protein E8E13_009424 [Curvularia kusanoi]
MAVKQLPTRLSELPTFTYTRADRNVSARRGRSLRQRKTSHKAMSVYKGKAEYTRYISQNMIDPANWEGMTAPRTYPTDLNFPADILKAVLYSRKSQRNNSNARATPRKGKCNKPTTSKDPPETAYPIAKEWVTCAFCACSAETSNKLCKCTTSPWSSRSTERWRAQHIELRWISDAVGLGTYALRPLRGGTVLGEYTGELVSGRDVESGYMLAVGNDVNATMGYIDALRVGGWTRFINHSCRPNTYFGTMRVGEELRYVVTASRDVRGEEEVTCDYGRRYWEVQNEKGWWCACGEKGCRFSEAAGRARVEKTARRREGR